MRRFGSPIASETSLWAIFLASGRPEVSATAFCVVLAALPGELSISDPATTGWSLHGGEGEGTPSPVNWFHDSGEHGTKQISTRPEAKGLGGVFRC